MITNIVNFISINNIMLTRLYTVKRGYTGYNIFLIFALKQRLWVLVGTASLLLVPTIYVLSKEENIKHFRLKISIFTAVKNDNILNGLVSVMWKCVDMSPMKTKHVCGKVA